MQLMCRRTTVINYCIASRGRRRTMLYNN